MHKNCKIDGAAMGFLFTLVFANIFLLINEVKKLINNKLPNLIKW